MTKVIKFLMLAFIVLQGCKPNEHFSIKQFDPDDIHTVSRNLDLFVPPPCKTVGKNIYKDLSLEKFRQRYVGETLQALVNLSG